MPTEKGYEREVVAWAEKRGWLVRKIQYVGRLGAPDRMFVRGGLVIFIEMKQRGGKISYHQKIELAALRAHRGFAVVCYTAEAAKEVLLRAEHLAKFKDSAIVDPSSL